MSIEAVIWDYGGVICPSPFTGLTRTEAELGIPAGSLSELFFGASYAHGDGPAASGEHDWHLLEKGRLELSGYLARLEIRSRERFGDIDLGGLRALGGGGGGVYWEMVHCIRSVKARGYRTAILTNNIMEFGEYWKASFPAQEVDVIVDSSHVGMRKPERAIYELTAARLDLDPTVCLFLDDVEPNVEAARSVGMRAIHVDHDISAAIAAIEAVLIES